MILDEIVSRKREELEGVKARSPLAEVKARALDSEEARDFRGAISADKVNIIAEVKKASPSKGVIRADFDPLRIAVSYEEAGAAAVSVLTESSYFQGSLDYLSLIRGELSIPLLRKDFIFDPYQIFEARSAGADALLLIAACLEAGELRDLAGLTVDIGMHALVEVHSEAELKKAISAGADIIGINNRNLKTFVTDIDTTRRLAALVPEGRVIVSESGINTAEDISSLRDCGAGAFLIGEALVRESDVGGKLRELLSGVS